MPQAIRFSIETSQSMPALADPSAMVFIIIVGPQTDTRSMGCSEKIVGKASTAKPLMPFEPSSVVT